MIIFINLIDPAGTPVVNANVVHPPCCCGVRSRTTRVNDGYQVDIFESAAKVTHQIQITAPGYLPQTITVEPGWDEMHSCERTVTLQPEEEPEEEETEEGEDEEEEEENGGEEGEGDDNRPQGHDPGIGGAGWRIDAAEPPALHCRAMAVSTKKPCRRKTTQDYCYQHEGKVTREMKKFAGRWKMSGRQAHVARSGWEADLELRPNGALAWKQTKGANVGARRSGHWWVENNAFEMRYRAPNVGRVEWQAKNPAPTHMQGTYRTPQAGPKGYGWGGEWSARKTPSKT